MELIESDVSNGDSEKAEEGENVQVEDCGNVEKQVSEQMCFKGDNESQLSWAEP